MSIFRRKKESFNGVYTERNRSAQGEEDYEDYKEEDSRRLDRRISSKKLRDLRPENRKKRKEPIKPWGKKERIFILAVVLFTILTSGALAASARSWKFPGLPRLAVPKINLRLFGEETIVIQNSNQPDKVNQEKIDEVKKFFRGATNNLSGIYALYVFDLKGNYGFGINQEEIIQAASLIKLPITSFVYKKYEEGEIDLDEKIPGSTLTYQDAVEAMAKRSDNSSQILLVKTLGSEVVESYIDEIGMEATSLADNETTAKDIGLFFEKLWKGEIVSEQSRDEILEYLTDTIYEEWLVAGIPDDVRVAHKYGREVHVVNDAGIIFASGPEGLRPGGQPFVLVIMSQGVVEREADDIFPQLSKIIYNEIVGE